MGFADITLEDFNWGPGLFIIGYHLALFILLPIYLVNHSPGWELLLATFVVYYVTGLCLTAGQHRLYSHRSYTSSSSILESIMLFFITSAAEGSAMDWAHDHRLHHKHVDHEGDPYNIEEGFMHAHLWWMFEKKDRHHEEVVPDLLDNDLVKFQHDHYGKLFFLSNVALVAALAWVSGDLLGALVIGFLGRIFLIHHSTWFINSLAHYWGAKPFSKEQSAVNNFVIALLTWGEGYHNYHHTFEGDYRNGVKWWQFDPAKMLIWTLNKLGLADNLNKVRESTIKKKLLFEDRKMMLEALKQAGNEKKDELKQRMDELYESLLSKIRDFNEERGKRRKELRKAIRKEWKEWARLSDKIISLAPEVAH